MPGWSTTSSCSRPRSPAIVPVFESCTVPDDRAARGQPLSLEDRLTVTRVRDLERAARLADHRGGLGMHAGAGRNRAARDRHECGKGHPPS